MTKPNLFPKLIPLFLLGASLAAVFLAACVPATSTVSPDQPRMDPSQTLPAPVPTLSTTTQTALGPTQAPFSSPSPAATSRGPELHATEPEMVSLASGQLQLVEFFRFT